MKTKLFIFSILFCAMTLTSCKSSSTAANSGRDGSSIEKAIKVTSVDKEYEYVRANCQDCQIKSQALISKGSKHYDVLRAVKPNGEEVAYYFDISSFFGKW